MRSEETPSCVGPRYCGQSTAPPANGRESRTTQTACDVESKQLMCPLSFMVTGKPSTIPLEVQAGWDGFPGRFVRQWAKFRRRSPKFVRHGENDFGFSVEQVVRPWIGLGRG